MPQLSEAQRQRLLTGVHDATYGLLNGSMILPVMISFTSIIFTHPAFQHYMPFLVKLVLASSVVHQAVFCLSSTLPFAIGQVQDAGLIFLSAMASSIAVYTQERNLGDEAMLATTLVVLSISTALLGVALIVTGKLKLATYVQYLPMPVVGGYLAFIGFFCGKAGLAMMAGVQLTTAADWLQLLKPQALIWLSPGLIGGIVLYICVRNFRHVMTLPVCMALFIAVFYIALALAGMSVEDAREYGWLTASSPASGSSVTILDAYALFDFSLVQWEMLPRQILLWIAMFLVVAFSSSLDVAAIEMELSAPLDYNAELTTVGLSNLVSGVLGGYTGSYIFSQTIFSLRSGVKTVTSGVVVILCELLVVVMPISITAFVPKCLFGALLIMIALDLMLEWLVYAYLYMGTRMGTVEYCVCLFTFFAICATDVEIGMALGILGAMVAFTVTYARSTKISVTQLRTSTVVRTFEERSILNDHRSRVATISLHGYIFFGSAVNILSNVKQHIKTTSTFDSSKYLQKRRSEVEYVAPASTPVFNRGGAVGAFPTTRRFPNSTFSGKPMYRALSLETSHLLPAHSKPIVKRYTNDSLMWTSPSRQSEEPEVRNRVVRFAAQPQLSKSGDIEMGASGSPGSSPAPTVQSQIGSGQLPRAEDSLFVSIWEHQAKHSRTPRALQLANRGLPRRRSANKLTEQQKKDDHVTEYLVLDFEEVLGVDATAARSCFLMLKVLMQSAGVTVVFTEMSPQIESLLRAHRVIEDTDEVFEKLDDALEWCEEKILANVLERDRSLSKHPSYYTRARKARDRVSSFASPEAKSPEEGLRLLRWVLEDYLEVDHDASPVRDVMPTSVLKKFFHRVHANKGDILFDTTDTSDFVYFIEDGVVELLSPCEPSASKWRSEDQSDGLRRCAKLGMGGIFGEVSFFLEKPQMMRAVAASDVTMWTLDRAAYARMEASEPRLCICLQNILLKSVSMTTSAQLFALNPTSHIEMVIEEEDEDDLAAEDEGDTSVPAADFRIRAEERSLRRALDTTQPPLASYQMSQT